MWPTIFEFNWDTGHMIFLGVFYSVLIVIATALVYVSARSIIETFNGHEDGHHSGAGAVPETSEEIAGSD
ncbi:hypothetical protein HZA56_08440 [Candidatus Poribacteria bacterium]|nr:hypothetical protein [Candidatus Poribacteria bacterium]